MSNSRDILSKYLPKQALDYAYELFNYNDFQLKITRKRTSKNGDFRVQFGKPPTITINNNLNQYAFLITYLHEVAHYQVFKQYKSKKKPHGKEWKTAFKTLILPMFTNNVFPETLNQVLKIHMKNPKASSMADTNLVNALRQYDDHITKKPTLNDLKTGTIFKLHGKVFKLGEKKRTRYHCTELTTKKQYTISQLAEVEPYNT